MSWLLCRINNLVHVFAFAFFFFFQAEDGIRDLTVTGVQTCALPISHHLLQLGSGGGVAWDRCRRWLLSEGQHRSKGEKACDQQSPKRAYACTVRSGSNVELRRGSHGAAPMLCAGQRIALKLRATRPRAHPSLNDSSCPLAHNTPLPLERSPPVSFKRLLGSANNQGSLDSASPGISLHAPSPTRRKVADMDGGGVRNSEATVSATMRTRERPLRHGP